MSQVLTNGEIPNGFKKISAKKTLTKRWGGGEGGREGETLSKTLKGFIGAAPYNGGEGVQSSGKKENNPLQPP